MTRDQLIADFRRVVEYDYDGFAGLDALDSDILRMLDRGLVELSRANPQRELILPITIPAGSRTIDLSDPSLTGGRVVFRVRKIRFGNYISQTKLGHTGILNLGDFESLYPRWPAAIPGSVVDVGSSDATTLIFYPPPSADYLAANPPMIDADVSPVLPSNLNAEDRLSFPEVLSPHVISAALYLNSSGFRLNPDQMQNLQLAMVNANRAMNREIAARLANKRNKRDDRACQRFMPRTVEL